jgi:predicted HTH transcriptional regulator
LARVCTGSSPGYPPKPLTLAKLRRGQYESCRRNPVLAECLAALVVPPSVEAQLNDRQKQIMVEVQTKGSVTSGWCRKTFGVAYQSVYRDLTGLVKAGLLTPTGSGRSTRYVIGRGGRD